jgi:hypothetical protein
MIYKYNMEKLSQANEFIHILKCLYIMVRKFVIYFQ